MFDSLIKRILLIFMLQIIIVGVTGCAPKQYTFESHPNLFCTTKDVNGIDNGIHVYISVEDASTDNFYLEKFWGNPYVKFVPPVLAFASSKDKIKDFEHVQYLGNIKDDFSKFIKELLKQKGFSIVDVKSEADHVILIKMLRHCCVVSGFDYDPNLFEGSLAYSFKSVFQAVTTIDGQSYEYYNEAQQNNSYSKKINLIPLPFGNKQSNEFVHRVDVIINGKTIGSGSFSCLTDGGAILAVPFATNYIINSEGSINLDKMYKWSFNKEDFEFEYGYEMIVTLHKGKIDQRMLWATDQAGPLNLLYRDYAQLLAKNIK